MLLHKTRALPGLVASLFAVLATLACPSLNRSTAQAQGVPDEYKRVIEKNLDWLARQQNQDGTWSDRQKQGDVTCTAVAGLAFLMEGSTAVKGKYAANIKQTVEWMVQNCREDGLLGANGRQAPPGYMTGQSYAVLFLASALAREEKSQAQGLDARLTGARQQEMAGVLKRAVAFIVKAQTSRGGWGVVSDQAGQDHDTTDITLQQLLALRAAQQAGIDIPKETFEKAYAYLEKMTTARGGIVFSPARAGSTGGERPGLTIAAFASSYGSEQVSPELLKKWLRYSQSMISPQGPTQDLFHLAIAVHGLGDAGYAKLFGTTGEALVWSKVRRILLNRFSSEGGVIYREWNPNPIFGSAINLIVLQLDNDYLPVFRTKKNW